MNEFRMGLLRERAEQIRPQLSEARQLAEKAEREGREMTTEERAIYDPVIKSAREIADGMKRVRDEDATMAAINNEFAGVTGGLDDGDLSSSGAGSKSRRLSFKGLGTKVATAMLGPDDIAAINDAQEYELGVDRMWRPTLAELLDDLRDLLQDGSATP